VPRGNDYSAPGALTEGEASPEPVEIEPGVYKDPEKITINADPATWPVVGRTCKQGEHNMVPDPTEKLHEAEICTICRQGRLLRPRVL
jgi:hypothetical protein